MIKTEYRPDIDGLRAIAVILVLGFHAFPKAVPAGFIGVDVFFVISGFLITGVILQREFSFLEFYARRARRLFPALTLVVAFSVVAGWLYLTPGQFRALGNQVAAAALFVPNLLFWSEAGYFDASALTKPLLHLWSLGVEEQFYFVWPLLLFATVKFHVRVTWILLGVTALSLLYCWHLGRSDATLAALFYSPLSRAWELSVGGLLALAGIKEHRSAFSTTSVIVGLCIIILSSFYVNGSAGWPTKMTLMVVLGSILVINFGATSKLTRQTLGSGPMVFLGKISYPLYLWHWPILIFLYIKNGPALSPLQVTAALFASFGLAALTHLAVEEPLKRRVPLKPLAMTAAAALGIIGMTGLTVSLLHGVPWRLPIALQEALAYEHYDAKSDAYNPGCWLGDAEETSKMLPLCLQTSRSDAIALWGDSHAARLSPGLRKIFGADRISQLTRNGCAPLLGLGAPASSGCRDGNAAILDLIRKYPPQMVILFGAWQNYPTDWKSGSSYAKMLIDTIEEIKATGISDIIVIGPAPRYEPSLPSKLLQDWFKLRWNSIPSRLQADNLITDSIENEIEHIALSRGVQFLSLLKLFCNEDGCLTKTPNSKSDLLTWDYGHLTTEGAVIAARAIQDLNNHRSASKNN